MTARDRASESSVPSNTGNEKVVVAGDGGRTAACGIRRPLGWCWT